LSAPVSGCQKRGVQEMTNVHRGKQWGHDLCVSAQDLVCWGKSNLLCLQGRSLLLWCLPVSREHQTAARSAASGCLQSDTPPDLRVLADVDVWGCHWRAKLWSSNHWSGNPLLCCEVFMV
jgi:hypothetical protein